MVQAIPTTTDTTSPMPVPTPDPTTPPTRQPRKPSISVPTASTAYTAHSSSVAPCRKFSASLMVNSRVADTTPSADGPKPDTHPAVFFPSAGRLRGQLRFHRRRDDLHHLRRHVAHPRPVGQEVLE